MTILKALLGEEWQTMNDISAEELNCRALHEIHSPVTQAN